MTKITAAFVKLCSEDGKQETDFYLPGGDYEAIGQALRRTAFELQVWPTDCNGITVGTVTVIWRLDTGEVDHMGDFGSDGGTYCWEGATVEEAEAELENVGFVQFTDLTVLKNDQDDSQSNG